MHSYPLVGRTKTTLFLQHCKAESRNVCVCVGFGSNTANPRRGFDTDPEIRTADWKSATKGQLLFLYLPNTPLAEVEPIWIAYTEPEHNPTAYFNACKTSKSGVTRNSAFR